MAERTSPQPLATATSSWKPRIKSLESLVRALEDAEREACALSRCFDDVAYQATPSVRKALKARSAETYADAVQMLNSLGALHQRVVAVREELGAAVLRMSELAGVPLRDEVTAANEEGSR